MKRNVGQKTVHVLRDLLKKKFEEKLREIHATFRHDFTYEKPYFDFTIRVDAYDFATTVMEQELLSMARKVKALEEKCQRLEQERYEVPQLGEIEETIHEVGDDVIAYQKKGDWHRLVICTNKPPQPTSEWVPRLQPIQFEDFQATWDDNKVVKINF